MLTIKKVKDYLIKIFFGESAVPRGLFELYQYFRLYDPIEFEYKKGDEVIVAISKNFRHGSIVTSGKNFEELDKNIKDAILTSFEIPSSYAKDAAIKRRGETVQEYALA